MVQQSLPIYQENNINFRIASSTAISSFKALQAHSFQQVTRKDLNFDSHAREILLLSYDRFSTWLLAIEKSLIFLPDHQVTEQFYNNIIESITNEFLLIEEICTNHKNIFSDSSIKLLKIIHSYTLELFNKYFSQHFNIDIDIAFEYIVNVISSYLQHVLVCSHEFNNNNALDNKEAFLGVTSFCAGIVMSNTFLGLYPESNLHENMCHTIKNRAKFYCEEFNINKFMLKNYTNIRIDQELIDSMIKLGYEVYLEPAKLRMRNSNA